MAANSNLFAALVLLIDIDVEKVQYCRARRPGTFAPPIVNAFPTSPNIDQLFAPPFYLLIFVLLRARTLVDYHSQVIEHNMSKRTVVTGGNPTQTVWVCAHSTRGRQ